MEFTSKLLEQAVDEMAQLPGIGKRTALRLVLHLLKQPASQTDQLSEALVALRHDAVFCESCHALADAPLCQLCSNPSRDRSLLCVVEDIRDVMALENTQQYKGLYHVLGGRISPMEGIGPAQLKLTSLIERVQKEAFQELIFALSSTIEADTTQFYIVRQLEGMSLQISTLSRGIAVGDELEYADELTLGRSIMNRVPVLSKPAVR
jgi:recombination protein RecR